MMLERETLLSSIASQLAGLSTYLKLQASQNLTSGAVLAEDMFASLLNLVFDYDLVNANILKKNSPGIDLEDAGRRLAYQVTLEATPEKIREVHRIAVKNRLSEAYDEIVILFLVPKGPSQPKASGGFEPCQEPAIRTMDLAEFQARVRGLKLDHIAAVDVFLREEIRIPISTPEFGRAFVSNLPFSSIGPLFKGRGTVISEIRTTLADPSSSEDGRPVVIHALGGVGKTRLAVEYAWRYKGDYRAFFYVSASEAATLKAQIAALSVRDLMCLPPLDDLDELYSKAIEWFREQDGWFLLIDNVDTGEAIAAVLQLLPHFIRGHVCITSRSAEWPDSVSPLHLGFLGDDDGRDYLIESTQGMRAPTADDEDRASELSARLGGLPLALEHSAAYIRKRRLGFEGYLSKLDVAAESVLNWHGGGMVQYPASVGQTWLVTYGELSRPEWHLLGMLSFVDSGVIPRWLFTDPDTGWDIEETLAGLAVWHFVTWTEDGTGCTIHPLVSEITRHQILEGNTTAFFLEELITLFDTAEIGSPQEPANWNRWNAVLPHVLQMVEHLEGEFSWRSAIVWKNRAAVFEQSRAHYGSSAPMLLQAWELCLRWLEEEDDLYTTVLNNLAGDLRLSGHYREAESRYRQALALMEKKYGAYHHELILPLNNLGELLRASHRIEEARDVHRRALDLVSLSVETHGSMLSTCLNALGEMLLALGEMEEAEALLRRSLAADEEEFGKNNPSQTVCLNNLGELLRQTDRLTEAEEAFRFAFELDVKHRGGKHPLVARVLNNWALLKAARGQLHEAEKMLRQAVEIDENAFGASHPTLAPDLLNLAEMLSRQKNHVEALSVIERAVAIYHAHSVENRHAPQEAAAADDLLRRIRERVDSSSD